MFSFHLEERLTDEMSSVKTHLRKLPESIHSHNISAITPIRSAAAAAH